MNNALFEFIESGEHLAMRKIFLHTLDDFIENAHQMSVSVGLIAPLTDPCP